VCRQLHFETNALGLKYNTVHFVDNNHGSAYSLFARFCALSSSKTLRRFKRVIILDALTQSDLRDVKKLIEGSFLSPFGIAEFSRAYPNTDVFVRFNWVDIPLYATYIHLSNDFLEALLGKRPWPESAFSKSNSYFMRAMFSHYDFACPTNLKFTPTHGFDEQLVHNGLLWIEKQSHTWKLDQILDDEKRRHMVAVARKMHEEGV
jgi:hypothetical protein